MVLIQSSPLPKIVFTSLFVCVYRVFGENAVCYNSDSLYVGNCAPVRKWWNWQTHHLEGVAPKGVGVQIPPSAPLPAEKSFPTIFAEKTYGYIDCDYSRDCLFLHHHCGAFAERQERGRRRGIWRDGQPDGVWTAG